MSKFPLVLRGSQEIVSYLVDNLDNQYPAPVLKLGSYVAETSGGDSICLTLEPNLPIKGSLIVTKVPIDASNVSLSLVYLDGIGMGWHRITVRNAPLIPN